MQHIQRKNRNKRQRAHMILQNLHKMNFFQHSNRTFNFHNSQVLASTVKNFLLLDLGLSIAFPTIVIPALTGLNKENNPNEFLHLIAYQASWLG